MTSSIELPPDLSARLAKNEKGGVIWEAPSGYRDTSKLRPAAVLLPLIKMEANWHLIFTLRSVRLHDHSGQVSFPGGSWETQDPDLVATALRESWEEIGLNPGAVRVVGCMARRAMVTSFIVTPVVGIVEWPTEITVNPDEVDRVFSIPLNWLAEPANQEFRVHTHAGVDIDIPYFKRYDGEVVWGATAMMTIEFLNLLRS